ncbi:hypothetical protein [Gimesia panareensis]|nr:hypothetical protein [Gimesia panareensis]
MVRSRYGTLSVIPSSKSTNLRGKLNDFERLCPDRNELEATDLSIGALTETRDDLTISVGVKVYSTGASVALSAGDDLFLSAGIARKNNNMFNKHPSSSALYLIESGEPAFPSSPRRHVESGLQRPDPASTPAAGNVSGGLEEILRLA